MSVSHIQDHFSELKQGLRFVMKTSMALAFFIVGLASCSDESYLEPIDMGYGYYPLSEGNYIVYQVDSIYYDDFANTSDTLQYQLLELIGAPFIDMQGDTAYPIERYQRALSSLPWLYTETWTVSKNKRTIQRVEDNIRYIKMVFPIKKSNRWNGNAYNQLEELSYQFDKINEPASFSGVQFDNTITVVQNNLITLISQDIQHEVYAKNIGLVSKTYIALEMDVDGTIRSGLNYSYTYLESGSGMFP
ncbi:MAG: hypothetical protein GX587_05180 [Bacteroidales bacterium]|nr:hypothetical protein [Bacteroidales bacterium]